MISMTRWVKLHSFLILADGCARSSLIFPWARTGTVMIGICVESRK